MTKADIINEIAEKTGVDKADVTASVEAFFSVIKSSMTNGNNIYIRGFGSFINKKRKKKIARNISRNTALVIEEHFVPSFKPAKIFVNKIKNSDKVKQLEEKWFSRLHPAWPTFLFAIRLSSLYNAQNTDYINCR